MKLGGGNTLGQLRRQSERQKREAFSVCAVAEGDPRSCLRITPVFDVDQCAELYLVPFLVPAGC